MEKQQGRDPEKLVTELRTNMEPVPGAESLRTSNQSHSEHQDHDAAASDAANLVDFTDPEDPANPKNWTNTRKWTIIGLISAVAFNQAMTSTIFAPAVSDVLDAFHSDSSAVATLLVSIFVIGLAIGPLFISPLSELYGRTIIVHITNFGFLVSSIVCTISNNVALLLVFRWVQGVMSVSLGGAFVADMMSVEQRSRAMNIWNLGPILAPIIGPIAGGYIALKASWRWTFGLVSIIAACLTVVCFVILRESYPPRLLQLRAKRLRKLTGNAMLRSKYDQGQTPTQLIWLSIVRPTKILLRCPTVGLVSLFVGASYSYLYLLFTTFPDVFERQYNFNTGEAGLSYLGLGVGALFGQYSLDVFMKRHIKRQMAKNGKLRSEDHLPPLMVGSVLIAVGLLWYGWSAEFKIHWAVPIVGTSFCGLGITWVFIGALTYLVDSFTLFAASALAANTVIRSIFGVTIPLAGPPLYESLGLGWGNSLLAFMMLLLAPMALVLSRYGERIRNCPRFQPHL